MNQEPTEQITQPMMVTQFSYFSYVLKVPFESASSLIEKKKKEIKLVMKISDLQVYIT